MADGPTGPYWSKTLRDGGGGTRAITWSGDAVSEIAKNNSRPRLNRCMMLEFDHEKHKWRDALRRTPRAANVANAQRRTPPRGLTQADYPSVLSAYAPHPAEPSRWEPALIGAALFLLPPVGVAMVWSSRRYDATAKVALTMFSGFTMCLAAIVAIFTLL